MPPRGCGCVFSPFPFSSPDSQKTVGQSFCGAKEARKKGFLALSDLGTTMRPPLPPSIVRLLPPPTFPLVFSERGTNNGCLYQAEGKFSASAFYFPRASRNSLAITRFAALAPLPCIPSSEGGTFGFPSRIVMRQVDLGPIKSPSSH